MDPNAEADTEFTPRLEYDRGSPYESRIGLYTNLAPVRGWYNIYEDANISFQQQDHRFSPGQEDIASFGEPPPPLNTLGAPQPHPEDYVRAGAMLPLDEQTMNSIPQYPAGWSSHGNAFMPRTGSQHQGLLHASPAYVNASEEMGVEVPDPETIVSHPIHHFLADPQDPPWAIRFPPELQQQGSPPETMNTQQVHPMPGPTSGLGSSSLGTAANNACRWTPTSSVDNNIAFADMGVEQPTNTPPDAVVHPVAASNMWTGSSLCKLLPAPPLLHVTRLDDGDSASMSGPIYKPGPSHSDSELQVAITEDTHSVHPSATDSQFGTHSMDPPSPTDSLTVCCGVRGCETTFRGQYRRGNRRRHMATQHGGVRYSPKVFLCEHPFCDSKFRRKDARLKHYRTHHPELSTGRAIPRR